MLSLGPEVDNGNSGSSATIRGEQFERGVSIPLPRQYKVQIVKIRAK
jgi:hypothetical protein